MANAEHLAILERGSEVWNTWRREQPETVPDLSEAHVQRRDLGTVNLARARLRLTTFERKAILRSAIFWKADLADAQLPEADLREANLRKAILFNTVLDG